MRAQDLHVSRHHHEVDPARSEQFELLAFRGWFSFWVNRDVPERDLLALGRLFQVGSIADDKVNMAIDLTELLGLDDGHETMGLFRHHHRDAPFPIRKDHLMLGFEKLCDARASGQDAFFRQTLAFGLPFDAHQESVLTLVPVLIRVDDVAALPADQTIDTMSDTRPIRTGEKQYDFHIDTVSLLPHLSNRGYRRRPACRQAADARLTAKYTAL